MGHRNRSAVPLLRSKLNLTASVRTYIECDGGCKGTIAKQTYTNTVITLDAADSTFGSTISVSGGATYSGLTNTGSGKVWKIATISVPAMLAS